MGNSSYQSHALGGDAEKFCKELLLIRGRQQIVDLFFLNENCLHYFKNLTPNFDFIEKTT